ncbi:MAG TPA: exosome complex RNA-binding protein Csl4 [Nitrososphaeraceae archaeon]|nr:exosome complex RNA-binding protein Csl4 [Nitrososphaeraceae archaeon]
MKIGKTKKIQSFPGDEVALIEEFESGKNTYVDDGSIRSSTVGQNVYDLRRRIVRIEQKNTPKLPKIGDIIVGHIDMLFGSMISVRILYINGVKSVAGFSAISSTKGISHSGAQSGWSRDRGDRRSRITFRVGDIIRGRVVSLLNSNIHITIAEKDFGVLYTLCYNCGGSTVKVNNAVKCVECGTYEERKLTADYGRETFRLIHDGKTVDGVE